MFDNEGTNRLQETEARVMSDSVNLFKELTSVGVSAGIISESLHQNNQMPNQYNQFGGMNPNGGMMGQQFAPQYQPYQQPMVENAYDPMAEFDMTPSVNTPAYIVEQTGNGANTKYNVKDSRTGQIYASCVMVEAANKMASLMNEGKLFTDVAVMKCAMVDVKFANSINEMRNLKHSIENEMNESAKQNQIKKLNEMKTEALNLKNSL